MGDTVVPQTPDQLKESPQETQKMVPERDLLAVKVGAERKETELLTQLAEANRLREEAHNNLLKMQAAKEQIEAQLGDVESARNQVEELQTKLQNAEKSVSSLNARLLDQQKSIVSSLLGVNVDTLAGKTLDQLKSLEEAAILVGKKPIPATLDIGGGRGAAISLTPLDQCREEIAAIRSKTK